MSKPNDAPNDDATAAKFCDLFERLYGPVYVKGSRSPLKDKAPRPDSDWDLEVITDKPMPSPRAQGWLHADVHTVSQPSVVSVPWREVIHEH